MSTVLYLYTIAVLEMSTAFSSGKQSMLFGAQMSTDFYIRKKSRCSCGGTKILHATLQNFSQIIRKVC